MKEFSDANGGRWRAHAREDDSKGVDYKGRLFMVLEPVGGSAAEVLELPEVRWNSARTADRTIATMSIVELRRRLRSALGRNADKRPS